MLGSERNSLAGLARLNPFAMTAKIRSIVQTEGFGGVIARIRRRWRLATFRPHVLDKQNGDIRFKFFVGTKEGQEWYGRFVDARLYKPLGAELAWLAAAVRPGDIVADVGAHHGYFATLFAHWIGPEGKVFAFECLPQNAEIAARNVTLNQLSNVDLVRKAVGGHPGSVEIADHSGGILFDPALSRNRMTVEMTTLDDFFRDRQPTMLKVDVEGYEIEVLKGARNCLAHRPTIALELHCFKFTNPALAIRTVFELLPRDGYRYEVAWEAGDPLESCELDSAAAERLARSYNPHLYGTPTARDSVHSPRTASGKAAIPRTGVSTPGAV